MEEVFGGEKVFLPTINQTFNEFMSMRKVESWLNSLNNETCKFNLKVFPVVLEPMEFPEKMVINWVDETCSSWLFKLI